MKKVGFFYSDTFLLHQQPVGHPERPERLHAIVSHLKEAQVWDTLHHLTPSPCHESQILSVHTAEHVELVRSVCENGGGLLDEGDTHAVEKSFDVALLAAGSVVHAIDAVVRGDVDSAFCAVRPPGHHAERDRPMGFCLFNNVAIGARHAQRKHGIERVAILDWDVHHGNGTQHIFEADPTVLYISLHQYPFYPGTGAKSERGIGEGEGYTLNFPLPAGTGEEKYLSTFKEEILPALSDYKPGLLIVSAGFDAHKDDPLGGMELTEGSFAKMTELVKGVAPIVSVLEGGYNLDALARSVERHVRVLMDG
ncbi:MAG: Histone deacetylase [Bacteroidetes bacterium]|nr:Histone deacetylase [Bacteroidota bacterium]